MEEEKLQLSDLRKPDAVVPRQALTDFVAPANQLDPIFNNTSIEDRVMATDGALLDGTIAERTQRLNDKKNKYNLLNTAYANAEENLVRETQGQGITQLGRRNTLVTNQRVLDAKRKKELADIEELRGNIETAEALRKESLKGSSKTEQEIIKENYINSLIESGASESIIASARDATAFTLINRMANADINQLDDFDKEFINQYIKSDTGSLLPSSVRLTSGQASSSSSDSFGGGDIFSPIQTAGGKTVEDNNLSLSVNNKFIGE